MMRKVIVVGDPPAPGGAVLPYGGHMSDVFGHRFALIGGRAYWEGCNSVGIIAKAGGPRRGCFHGAEMALEGDVVVCHCPVPPPLVGTMRKSLPLASNPEEARFNADSITGYVLYVD